MPGSFFIVQYHHYSFTISTPAILSGAVVFSGEEVVAAALTAFVV